MSANTQNVLLSTFEPFENGTKQPLKRIIDNTHPMNLVNFYGNEPVTTLWSSIPANQKPFTIILIVLGHTLLPGNSTKYLEDTADICEANEIPYAIQVISGETHNEERLPIAYLESRFAQQHQYYYGLNGAELYNGVTWRGEIESNNSQYIIDCISLVVKYGAFFIWTDTNMNYDSGMLLQWFETNEAFYSAFKNNAENIVLMNKESYGTPSTYSVMQGLWLAGLVGNWGVASDWWHWQVDGDKKSLFGEFDEYVDNEWDLILSFPENMYVQSMMLVMSCGGTCFKAEAPNFSISAGGVAIAGFEYGISPLLNSIISGELTIPTKAEVLQASPAAVLGKENYPEFNYNFTESNLYPAAGRYRIIPLLPANLRLAERAVFEENGIALIDKKEDQCYFDELFIQEALSNTYAMRTAEQWFYINNVENARSEKTAVMTPAICSAASFSITAQEHTSAVITEKTDSLSFYVSNYRTDKTNMVKTVTPEYRAGKSWVDISGEFMTIDASGNPKGLDDSIKRITTIKVNGKLNGDEPEIVWRSNTDGTGPNNRPFTFSKIWNQSDGIWTLVISHNGPVKFDILLDTANGNAGTVRREPTGQTLQMNNNSTAGLQKLINSLPVVEKTDYIYYSYLQYNAALEKARVIIAEKTYSKLQIIKAKTELQNSFGNLVDISKCTDLLKTATPLLSTSPDDSKLSILFDALLRETLSNNIYAKSRSSSLEYMEKYKGRKFNARAKAWMLEKRYNELLNEVNSVTAAR